MEEEESEEEEKEGLGHLRRFNTLQAFIGLNNLKHIDHLICRSCEELVMKAVRHFHWQVELWWISFS